MRANERITEKDIEILGKNGFELFSPYQIAAQPCGTMPGLFAIGSFDPFSFNPIYRTLRNFVGEFNKTA